MKANHGRIGLIFMLLALALSACVQALPTEEVTPPSPSPAPTLTPTATPPPEFPKLLVPREVLAVGGPALVSSTECPELMSGLPGGVLLGVDPTSCRPIPTMDSYAVLDLYVPYEYAGSVLTLIVSWPVEQSRGLRASTEGQTALIRFDQQEVWRKRAVSPGADGVYYAARDLPQRITFVPGKAGAHQVEFMLPGGMTWDIGSIEIHASDYPTHLQGVAYTPYRDCQTPDFDSPQPGQAEINADLTQIFHSANAVRTYSATGVSGEIPWLAEQLGIPVYAGVWLDGDEEEGFSEDQVEMEAIDHILDTSTVQAVIVGNEYYLRHQKEPGAADYLLSRILEFKQAHPDVPVGTAEIDTDLFAWPSDDSPVIRAELKAVLDAVDILFVHIYPFWQEREVEGAAAFTAQRYLAIQKLLAETYGGQKRLILGEAGWPSAGMPDAQYAYTDLPYTEQVESFSGSPAAQRRYLVELLGLAKEHGIDLFYFDAIDELWKKEGFGGVGRNWGFDYSDRSTKYDLSSLLLPAALLPDPKAMDVFKSSARPYYDPASWLFPVFSEWPIDPYMPSEQAADFDPFVPALMGDLESMKMYACEPNSRSGDTALHLRYVSGGVNGWAGITWLYPAGNWGETEAGVSLAEAQSLSFWARGKQGGEVVEFFVGGVCGPYDGRTPPLCPDSLQPKRSTGNLVLENKWKRYIVDLSGADLTNVVGGFGLAVSQVYNPQGAEFDLDEVVYLSSPPDEAQAEVYPRPIVGTFHVYTDAAALDNHYIPSNFMGDGALGGGHLELDQDWPNDPRSGDTSIRVDYTRGPQGWAGVYWSDPENNWGQRPGGYDLSAMRRLTFWARADKPGMVVEFIVGGIGCGQAGTPYPDSVCGKVSKKIALETAWTQYSIDLLAAARDWSRVLGGFGFSTNQAGTFYLDDITYSGSP